MIKSSDKQDPGGIVQFVPVLSDTCYHSTRYVHKTMEKAFSKWEELFSHTLVCIHGTMQYAASGSELAWKFGLRKGAEIIADSDLEFGMSWISRGSQEQHDYIK